MKTKNTKKNLINNNNKTKKIKCNILNNENKYILKLYFGIATTAIYNILNNKYNNKIEYLYFGKSDLNYKILNKNIKFNKIKSIKCFLNNYNNYDNIIYKINDNKHKYIMVFFAFGISGGNFEYKIKKMYDSTKSISELLEYEKNINNYQNKKNKYNELILLILEIKKLLETKEYKYIILSGQSDGSSCASLFAYILLILSVDNIFINKLPKYHKINDFINNIKQYCIENNLSENIIKLNNIKDLIQNNIYICGTGGRPMLWNKIEDFNIFKNFFKNKYIHVISGNIKNNIQLYDPYTIYNLHNEINQLNILNYEKKIKKQKTKKYIYINYGSIIFNKIENNVIKCYNFDKIVNNIYKNIDNINYSFEDSKYLHDFSFYRYLYNKYYNKKTKNNKIYNYS